MRRLPRCLSALLAILLACSAASAKDDGLPKSGVPIPMETVDIRGLSKVTDVDHDTIWLLENTARENGEASVRFKALSVDGDQEAGILFRYTDAKNYYAVVANAQIEQCALYRVKDGTWKMEDSQDAITTPLTWHELRVIFTPEGVTALLDGQLTLGDK